MKRVMGGTGRCGRGHKACRVETRFRFGLEGRSAIPASDGRDAQSVLADHSILDQAGGKCFLERAQLSIRESRRRYFNAEIAQAKRTRRALCRNAHPKAFGGQIAQAQILDDKLAHAASNGAEQEFSRCHTSVTVAIFGGLIDYDTVMPGLGDETGAARVLQAELQGVHLGERP